MDDMPKMPVTPLENAFQSLENSQRRVLDNALALASKLDLVLRSSYNELPPTDSSTSEEAPAKSQVVRRVDTFNNQTIEVEGILLHLLDNLEV